MMSGFTNYKGIIHRKINSEDVCFCGSKMLFVGNTFVCIKLFQDILRDYKKENKTK